MKKIKQLKELKRLNKKTALVQFLCMLTLFVMISGCGYTTKSLISRKINSIYIPIFENDTFRKGLEFGLTTAVKDEIMSKTKLRIVHKDDADTILSGRIVKVTESLLSSNFADNIVESRVTIFVDMKLVDRRTGRTILAVEGLDNPAEFIVNRGENINSASQESLIGLAEKIVSQLEEKW